MKNLFGEEQQQEIWKEELPFPVEAFAKKRLICIVDALQNRELVAKIIVYVGRFFHAKAYDEANFMEADFPVVLELARMEITGRTQKPVDLSSDVYLNDWKSWINRMNAVVPATFTLGSNMKPFEEGIDVWHVSPDIKSIIKIVDNGKSLLSPPLFRLPSEVIQ